MSEVPKFKPGEVAYIKLAFSSEVPIKNAFVVFVHEQDENEHLMLGFKADEGRAINLEKGGILHLRFQKDIPQDAKPGIYALERINFNTFGGQTFDCRDIVTGDRKLEVVPEPQIAPKVWGLSIFTREDLQLNNEEEFFSG